MTSPEPPPADGSVPSSMITGPSEPVSAVPSAITGPTEPVSAGTPAPPGQGPGWLRRMAKLWGFLGFAVLVLVLFRHVLLPFIFALLLAYMLAPVVGRMSTRRDGTRRMPRGLAIILCYVVLLSVIGVSVVAMLPKLSDEVSRIGHEAPVMYRKLHDDWSVRAGRWLERRFPSLAPAEEEPELPPIVADVPLPPGTQAVITPLPDGRFAIQLEAAGVRVREAAGGGYLVLPNHASTAPRRIEDRIRAFAEELLGGLEARFGELVSLGQTIVQGVATGVMRFFLVLMVAAFILLDLEHLHGFARGLVPARYRRDYDVVVSRIDRGLGGVIRGQLVICLVNGVLTYVGLLVFSIKYALVLALVAALLSLIPIFGSILSTIPIVAVALVSGESGFDVTRGAFILLWIIGIHFLEANFLNPKIIGTAAKIHPVLVVFALIAGEQTWGLVGALLAVPVASVIQVLFLFFRSKAWRVEPGAH